MKMVGKVNLECRLVQKLELLEEYKDGTGLQLCWA